MKVIFLGSTQFSKELLSHLLENKINIQAIFTSPEQFSISYSENKVKNYNFADIKPIAKKFDIPVFEVDSTEGKRLQDYKEQISKLDPDVILAMGWYYMVPKPIRNIPKFGAWGIHASLLPKYAGGAPLVWAMIKGEKEAGVTLFKLDSGVDDGDVIAQEKIPILFEDTIKEVYEKATAISKTILLQSLKYPDQIVWKSQDKTSIEIFPQRKPEDGKIDLSMTGLDMYNFIRAQSAPYPGAYIETQDGKKIIIEKARLEE